jgi:hypothetical protein
LEAMSASVWSQIDAGVSLALGAIVVTAAVRKLARPRVFALTLQRLDPALSSRRSLTIRLAFAVAVYELVVGVGVVAFRGTAGFGLAAGRMVACACFGRLGRTAAGGREIGRGVALLGCSGFLVVHRALDASASDGYGFGVIALVSVVGTALVMVMEQRIGAAVRPGVELEPAGPGTRRSFANSLRRVTGYDNDLYTTDA